MTVPLRERKQSSLFCVQLTAEIVKRIGIFFSKPEEVSVLSIYREKVASLGLDLYKTVHKVKDAFPKNPDLQVERSIKCKEAKLLIEDIFYIFELGSQLLAIQKKKEQALKIIEQLEKLDQILDKIRFKCVEEVINAEKSKKNEKDPVSTSSKSKNVDDSEEFDSKEKSSSKPKTNQNKDDFDDWDDDF